MNTMQQEFDAVVTHLFKQGKPAIKSSGCFYRTTDCGGKVLSCAVGCRIPDTTYVPGMDEIEGGTQVDNLIANYRAVLPAEIIAYQPMFTDLQSVHDNPMYRNRGVGGFDLTILEPALRAVADDYNLTFTVPTQGEQYAR